MEVLNENIDDVIDSADSRFLSSSPIGPFTVRLGDNILPTSYQYTVHDEEGDKLLTLKLYDKIVDLVSREGSAMVGSRIAQVIGSRITPNKYTTRLSSAETTGLTRLEVSIHGTALFNHNPVLPSIRTLWPKKVHCAMNKLVDDFMNDPLVLHHAYRKLSVPDLLASVASTPHNILAIGKRQSFLLNARTPTKRFVVGSKHSNNFYMNPGH